MFTYHTFTCYWMFSGKVKDVQSAASCLCDVCEACQGATLLFFFIGATVSSVVNSAAAARAGKPSVCVGVRLR